MACLIVTDSQVRHLPARPADLSSSQWQLTYGPHDLAHVLERVQLVFITATTLPLLVALTEIGLASGTMLPENAAALVGAGVLSVVAVSFRGAGIRRSAAAIDPEYVWPNCARCEQLSRDPPGVRVGRAPVTVRAEPAAVEGLRWRGGGRRARVALTDLDCRQPAEQAPGAPEGREREEEVHNRHRDEPIAREPCDAPEVATTA